VYFWEGEFGGISDEIEDECGKRYGINPEGIVQEAVNRGRKRIEETSK
jgi:hypothetical protein